MSTPGKGASGRREASSSNSGSRRDQNEPGKKSGSPSVRRNMKCRECEYTCSSMTELKLHFQKTNHKQADDAKSRDPKSRDAKPRDEISRDAKPRDVKSWDAKTQDVKSRDAKPQEVKSQTVASKPEPQKKEEPATGSVPGMVPDHIRKNLYFLTDYVRRKDREPVIGLQYILEYKVQVKIDKTEIKYFCELCEMDSGVIPMVDHVCGFRHRKLYVGKEYPFVLKALFTTKEDKALFMRRMAEEIEREEGPKAYKRDPVIRMVSVMNVKSIEAKQSKRTTRWNSEGDRQIKMKQALEYLDSFEINNASDATTITRLSEKLTGVLKFHTDKLKEEALFPAKVARAKDVAMSLVQAATRARMASKAFTRGPSGNFIPSLLSIGQPQWTPNNAFPQRPQESFFPLNQMHNSQMALQNAQRYRNATSTLETQIDENDEDIQFFKKLLALLDVLPESSMLSDESELDSKLLMLKCLLEDDTDDLGNTPADPLMMQGAPLAQDMARMENIPRNQQMNTMASNNTATLSQFEQNLLMQVASMADNAQANQNSLMQVAALLQNSQTNANTFLPDNRMAQNREYVQMDNNSPMLPNQTAYLPPHREQRPSTSQSNENLGYDRLMPGKYGSTNSRGFDGNTNSRGFDGNTNSRGFDGNTNRRGFDDTSKSLGFTSKEPSRDTFADRRYTSGMHRQEWDESNISKQGANQDYGDYTGKQAPYTRIYQSPNRRPENERFENNCYDEDLRTHEPRPNYAGRSSRSFDDPSWIERENDLHYGKRSKLDSGDHRIPTQSTDWGRHRPGESDSLDTNSANLSVDLLKRIRGKDLFTVTALLSEYADGHSSK